MGRCVAGARALGYVKRNAMAGRDFASREALGSHLPPGLAGIIEIPRIFGNKYLIFLWLLRQDCR